MLRRERRLHDDISGNGGREIEANAHSAEVFKIEQQLTECRPNNHTLELARAIKNVVRGRSPEEELHWRGEES